MQLLILTNNGTCSNSKALNNELILSSQRVKSTKYKNGNFKKVCSIEIRGKYHKNKTVVDDEVVTVMKEQFQKQYRSFTSTNSKQLKDNHSCLHIYAHDGTFGLRPSGLVPLSVKKAYIIVDNLCEILIPYLNEFPMCSSIKLHVCFSGCDYNGTEQSYGEKLRDSLEQLMHNGTISPARSMIIEASNGWSILGNNIPNPNKPVRSGQKTIDYWSHHVLPNNNEMRQLLNDPKSNFQTIIPVHALHNLIGKPKYYINI